MRAVLKVEFEEECGVAELRLGNGNIGFLAEECVPDRLRARVDVRPRADLLQGKPACLRAERIGRAVPRAGLEELRLEMRLICVEGAHVAADEHHIERNHAHSFEERAAARGIDCLRDLAVLASAVHAALGLISAPDAIAVAAGEDGEAHIGGVEGNHGVCGVFGIFHFRLRVPGRGSSVTNYSWAVVFQLVFPFNFYLKLTISRRARVPRRGAQGGRGGPSREVLSIFI